MPMHNWTRVEAGIFHAFHHRWITSISDMLNTGMLPQEYYALPEQQAAGFGPDVLTLQSQRAGDEFGGGGVVDHQCHVWPGLAQTHHHHRPEQLFRTERHGQ